MSHFQGGIFSHSVCVYLTWGPVTWRWPKDATLYAVSFSSLHHNTDGWMLLVRRKLPLIRWPSLENRDRKKSSGQANVHNMSQGQNLSSTSAEPQARIMQVLLTGFPYTLTSENLFLGQLVCLDVPPINIILKYGKGFSWVGSVMTFRRQFQFLLLALQLAIKCFTT